jgi:chromosome segregation ATPase
MTSQGHLEGAPNSEPLALRITTKSAFLTSRTAKDAAISTLAQQNAEHTRLQELHRGLIVQLEQKETQILNLKEIAAKAQAASTERELELKRAAETARSALSQEEAEHARLKERYRDCLAKLELKDAEILGLHGKIKALFKEHIAVTHAAHAASTEYEVEISHLQTLFENLEAELEHKSSQTTELDGTIEHLTQECSDLKESETGLQEALVERTRNFEHATDAAAVSLAQYAAEKRRLEDVIHGRTTQINEKEAHIIDLEERDPSLVQENNNLRSKAAGVNNSLAAMTQDLKQITTEAFAKIRAAKAVKDATDQRVIKLLSYVEALEEEALRCKKQLRDAARTQAQSEAKRRDAVDETLNVQAASDQLKRDNALLFTEVDKLQARKELPVEQLANLDDAHARTKEEWCNAITTISELRTAKAEADGDNGVLTTRLQHLTLHSKEPAEGVITVVQPPTASSTCLRAIAASELKSPESFYATQMSREDLRSRFRDVRKAVTSNPHKPYVPYLGHVHSSGVAHGLNASRVTGVSAETRRTQAVPSPPSLEPDHVRDDSDLYDWVTARASGLFDFWSNHLHGSDIMELIQVETEPEETIDWISNLMFDGSTRGAAQWLICRSPDRDSEERRLEVVHLLNRFVGIYGCKGHRRIHIYPDGSREQNTRVQHVLDRLREGGAHEHVREVFVASLSCFSGRACLAFLEECGIFLDHKECEMLSQKCKDKRRAMG